ncbi:MAG TPA: 30S ribosomal protein S2 [Candidatus Paceibacterota bacterium]|nr:30S ribosomal protein S2 [Candidatus Paceibacterota bacterium]
MAEKTEQNSQLIEKMFSVGAHFGYSRSRRHPTTSSYIFGAKNKVEIINLEKTEELLNSALEFVKKLASEGKVILFVSGKNEAKEAVEKGANSIEMPYVAGRWVGGTFTNFDNIKKRVEKMQDLISQREKGELGKYTKKERLLIDRQIDNLQELFSGLVLLKQLPTALFVVDSRREKIAVEEAKKLNIPVIALCGSDCNLKEVDYPIVANDSSITSIKFFVEKVVEAYKQGKQIKSS